MKRRNRLEKLDLDLIQELNAKESEMISGGAIAFREVTIKFDSSTGKQKEPATALFGGRVLKAQAFLKGFNIGFDNGDREFLRQQIDLDVKSIRNNAVEINADFRLRDSSGYYDDPYSGWVQAVVIADVV